MGRDTFDAALASVPRGATAARVTARSRDNWTPKRQPSPGLLHWSAPPPMFAWAAIKVRQPDLPDLTGYKYGRMTVLGLMTIRPGDNGLRWVVRCACGDFEVRRTKAIRNGTGDRCDNCDALRSIQYKYEKFGGRAVDEFVTPKATA